MERDYSLIHLDQTVSTNSYLNTLCEHEEVPDFTVVWADFQTAGRGQRGNSWESNAGENLTFSYVLHPDFVIAQEQFLLSEIAALAVKETLEEYVEYVSIKWPNDIYWKQKKICGMLIENNLTGISIHRSICGVGININQEVFNGSAPNPISLRQIIGRVVDLIDEDVLKGEYIGCHPCVCTSSLKIRTKDIIEKYLPATGHDPMIVHLVGED